MPSNRTDLLNEVAAYYADRLAEHGVTPRGVDWNGAASQILRFEQLCKVIGESRGCSLNDVGCGYGALLEFLRARGLHGAYLGVDVSEEMIGAARKLHAGVPNARFFAGAVPDELADYGVASGIFNVRLSHEDSEWLDYIESMLEVLDRTSRLGFAFNCLTSYSDRDKMRDDLYYADPRRLFDLCKRRYSRDVALLHDYGLYEFTLLVRKAA